MPKTLIAFYKEDDGSVPMLEWLETLPKKARIKYRVRIERLATRRLDVKKRKPATDAVEIIHRRFFEGKPEQLAALEEARATDAVARKIYALRNEAGLTQRQLAKFVGTTASVICRLEDADYEGHSLAMLNRIALALDQRVEINFVPLKAQAHPV